MANSTHSRYSLSIPQSSRDEAVRLPSIKDLNFHYARRHSAQDLQPPPDSPVHPQENTRWSRPNIQQQQQQSSPTSHIQQPQHLQQQQQQPLHQQQQQQQQQQQHLHHLHHQHQHQHPHHQQHTPPLSAGHELHSKNDYASKQDGAFLTPGMPLSAQSTPVPGSVTIGPGTRGGDDGPHSKRRRSSGNMNNSRDTPTSHTSYPHYASYPPPQQPQQAYSQMQPPISHQPHAVQPPLEHAHNTQVAVPHPSYATYPHQQQQYMPTRVQPHPHPPPPPPQHQPAPANPYPSPAPLPTSQAPWEQPHHPQQPQHAQPSQHAHQPPSQIQHQQAHSQSAHPPVPSHAPHHHHSAHVITQHQPPPPPPPPSSQHHIQHQQQQHQQPQQQNLPPPQAHHIQHPQPEPQPQQPPPEIQQQPPMPYTSPRTSIAPIDTRNQYSTTDRDRSFSAMSQIVAHCWELTKFASKYAGIRSQTPDVIPTPEELTEMSQRAVEVLRLLEEYRRLQFPEPERVKIDTTAVITPPDDHRPPKRPWEDMSQDENAGTTESTASFAEEQYPTPVDKVQSTAEQDMDIIRMKRATSAAGGTAAAGQPKSKYRKRSRATPPGKCHSCNIRETPEWRRGPDGARTLCNACGLHYAKLQRKRDKQAGPNGDAPRIDLETLRASARAAEIGEKAHPRSKHSSRQQQSNGSDSPMDTSKPRPPPPQQHHQGTFQVVTMVTPDSSVSSTTSDSGGRAPGGQQQHQHQHQQSHQAMQQQQQQMSSMAPSAPPPWSTSAQSSAPSTRGYAPEQLQHQSYMRTTTTHTSPR